MMANRWTPWIVGAALLLSLALAGSPVMADLIDDFDTPGLGEYTFAKVLDQGTATNVSFSDAGGTLDVSSAGADGAEQVLLFRGESLPAGKELQIDGPATISGANDLGLAVGQTPTDLGDGNTGNNRALADFLFISYRSSTQLNSRGFNGNSEIGQVQQFGVNADRLFIARLANDDMELGWYDGNTRNVARTETPATADIYSNIGFYADLRGDGNMAVGLDNLSIVPEPASLTVAGLGLLGALGLRRSRRRK